MGAVAQPALDPFLAGLASWSPCRAGQLPAPLPWFPPLARPGDSLCRSGGAGDLKPPVQSNHSGSCPICAPHTDAISATNPRVIDDSRARKLSNDLKRCTYYETCATYGLNVERVFQDGRAEGNLGGEGGDGLLPRAALPVPVAGSNSLFPLSLCPPHPQWRKRWWPYGRSSSSPSGPASRCPIRPATPPSRPPPCPLSTSTRWG